MSVDPCYWCGEPDYYHYDCVSDMLVDLSPQDRQATVRDAYWEARDEMAFAAFPWGVESAEMRAAGQQRYAAVLSKWERSTRGCDS